MKMIDLPPNIRALLQELEAPERLLRHLQLVHATARALLTRLGKAWPTLRIDEALVLFGAATHDIGKVTIPAELVGPGKQHEAAGERLLLERGFSEEEARFARTHGHWQATELPLEDGLVTLADKLWKGKRVEGLEEKIGQALADQLGLGYWTVYPVLDALLEELVIGADARMLWQNQ